MARTVSSPPARARSRSATTTFAPSRAKRTAHARPMPLAAPVTRPALPAMRPDIWRATLDQRRGPGWCRSARSVADPCRPRIALERGLADLARRELELALEDAAEVGGVAEAPAERDLGDRAAARELEVLVAAREPLAADEAGDGLAGVLEQRVQRADRDRVRARDGLRVQGGVAQMRLDVAADLGPQGLAARVAAPLDLRLRTPPPEHGGGGGG